MTRDPFDRRSKRSRVDRWVAIDLRLNRVEVLQQLSRFDQSAPNHLFDVSPVLLVAALDFRQRLRVQIIVMERQPSVLFDGRACDRANRP